MTLPSFMSIFSTKRAPVQQPSVLESKAQIYSSSEEALKSHIAAITQTLQTERHCIFYTAQNRYELSLTNTEEKENIEIKKTNTQSGLWAFFKAIKRIFMPFADERKKNKIVLEINKQLIRQLADRLEKNQTALETSEQKLREYQLKEAILTAISEAKQDQRILTNNFNKKQRLQIQRKTSEIAVKQLDSNMSLISKLIHLSDNAISSMSRQKNKQSLQAVSEAHKSLMTDFREVMNKIFKSQFSSALEAWQKAVGAHHVVTLDMTIGTDESVDRIPDEILQSKSSASFQAHL